VAGFTEPSAVAPDAKLNFEYSVNPSNYHHPNLNPASGATALGSVMTQARVFAKQRGPPSQPDSRSDYLGCSRLEQLSVKNQNSTLISSGWEGGLPRWGGWESNLHIGILKLAELWQRRQSLNARSPPKERLPLWQVTQVWPRVDGKCSIAPGEFTWRDCAAPAVSR